MGVKLLESLEMQTGLPLDKRNIVQNIDQRNNINPALRYIGMEVFVADKNKKYRLEEGIENFNWIDKDTIKSSDLVTDTDHLTVTQAEKDKWSGKAERVHKHTKDDITDFPVALKNPNALTIKLNGTSQGAYDGSSVKEINITAENVGAQPKGNYAPTVHTHTKSQIIDFPTVLPNPHSLVIQANGSSLGDYDGSAGKAFNITASNVGAYTKGEVDERLNGKANTNHGTHIPSPQTANNKVYLRNDNTWHTITPQEIGAQPAGSYANSSHSHAWGDVTGKPSTFTPSEHSHNTIKDAGDNRDLRINYSANAPIDFGYVGVWKDSVLYAASKNNFLLTSGGTLNGALTVQGNVTCSDCITTSDERLKKDIIKIDNALEKVNQLNGYTFLKEGDNQRTTGLIAQEVLKVLPEAVFQREDGYYAVSYGNIVGLLIEAIKELQEVVINGKC